MKSVFICVHLRINPFLCLSVVLAAIEKMPSPPPIIDTNITLGQWPTRRVPCDNLETLIAKLRAAGVIHAWAGHYDGPFHTNLTDVNNRLAAACNRVARPEAAEGRGGLQLVPFASINPTAPDWESELDRCATIHRMPGIRLHPNYHNYRLDHPNFARLLIDATERKLIVQLAILMEDARMMHPLMRVPPVDVSPLEKIVSQTPGLRLVLLNATTSAIRTDTLSRLTNGGEVYVDIAMLETLAALETLVKDIPVNRILFGSHAPSFYFEAAALKLRESQLPATHLAAITYENAQRLVSI
jgi:predicted TIM-barrel fold metal-dependent hydrolase